MTAKSRRRAARRDYPLELLDASLYEIDMPERVVNFLVTIDVFTVGDLLQKRPQELLDIRNFGEKSLEIVFDRLAAAGFHREPPRPSRPSRPRRPRPAPRLAVETIPEEAPAPAVKPLRRSNSRSRVG